MSQSVNGDADDWYSSNIPKFIKYTAINNPGPAQLFAFIDVHEDEIVDAQFGIPSWPQAPGYGRDWWDLPANRHNQGCNLSFADGHAAFWKWLEPTTQHLRPDNSVYSPEATTKKGDRDLERFRQATYQPN